jgi:hypothetical protein
MNHLIDEELLEAIEAHPAAYFKNSPHNVRKYLERWKHITQDNINVCKDTKGVDEYMARQYRFLERITTLQKGLDETINKVVDRKTP